MQDQKRDDVPSQDPVEGSNDVPPPERGSPGADTKLDDEGPEKTEKDAEGRFNPLAPPVNIEPGS